jgi:hypothetical protein
MTGFEPARDGVHVDLTPWAWVLRLYLDDIDDVLGPPASIPDDPLDALAAEIADPPERPTDPVRARLLPDGFLDDPDAATEFRRFSETTLAERKRSDAAALRGVLDEPTVVDPVVARQLLGAINDLRLMLGTRLAVSESGVLAGGEDLHSYRTYQLLTYLQGELVDVLSGEWQSDEGEGDGF